MSLSLISGCTSKVTNEEDPYAIYLAAMEKTETVEQMQGQMSYEISMKYNGSTIGISATSEVKASIVGGKPVAYQNFEMNFWSLAFESEYYDYDGFRYTLEDGVKTKETIPVYDSGLTPIDFTKDDIISSTFEKVDKGSKYGVTLSGDFIEESLADLVALDFIADLLDVDEIDKAIFSAAVTIYFTIDNDGYFCELSLQYEGTANVNDSSFTLSIEINMSFTFGDVTIELPDFSEYV